MFSPELSYSFIVRLLKESQSCAAATLYLQILELVVSLGET